jgi:hypothetical protein
MKSSSPLDFTRYAIRHNRVIFGSSRSKAGKESVAAKIVSSQKRGETSRRFERLNQLFEGTFGTVRPHPQIIEKIPKIPQKANEALQLSPETRAS